MSIEIDVSENIRRLQEIVPNLSTSPCGPKATWNLPEGTSEAWGIWRDGNDVSVTKARLQPGARFPIHVHKEDEHLIVYRGALGITFEEGAELVVTEGRGVYIPPGKAHSVRAIGPSELLLVVIHVPAGEGLPHGKV